MENQIDTLEDNYILLQSQTEGMNISMSIEQLIAGILVRKGANIEEVVQLTESYLISLDKFYSAITKCKSTEGIIGLMVFSEI